MVLWIFLLSFLFYWSNSIIRTSTVVTEAVGMRFSYSCLFQGRYCNVIYFILRKGMCWMPFILFLEWLWIIMQWAHEVFLGAILACNHIGNDTEKCTIAAETRKWSQEKALFIIKVAHTLCPFSYSGGWGTWENSLQHAYAVLAPEWMSEADFWQLSLWCTENMVRMSPEITRAG